MCLSRSRIAGDTNMLLLPCNGPTPEDAANDSSGEAPVQKRLSKAQQRKQRRVQEEKAARERRAAVLADLAAHSLSAGQLALLRPTALRGQVRHPLGRAGCRGTSAASQTTEVVLSPLLSVQLGLLSTRFRW